MPQTTTERDTAKRDRPVPRGRSGFELVRLLGIPVRIDPSWFLVFGLVSWSLATGWFPTRAPGLTVGSLWTMGAFGAIGLFVSIVIHEFSHSLVARREGVQIRSITLFLFGGVAEMDREPPNPGAEARIAIAGPVASIMLSLLAFGAAKLIGDVDWIHAALVVEYIGIINGVLAAFNLIPAFPMDGGRLFRAWLWHRKGDAAEATRRAARMGSTFGAVLIGLGIFSGLQGDLISGMWLAFIGLFVRKAAASSVQQTAILKALKGESVLRFAQTQIVVAQPEMTVQHLVDELLLRHHYTMYPVMDGPTLLGSVSTAEVQTVPRERWSDVTVGEVMAPLTADDVVEVGGDAMEALTRMAETQRARLIVVDDQGELRGLLTLKDLLGFIRIAAELGALPQASKEGFHSRHRNRNVIVP